MEHNLVEGVVPQHPSRILILSISLGSSWDVISTHRRPCLTYHDRLPIRKARCKSWVRYILLPIAIAVRLANSCA